MQFIPTRRIRIYGDSTDVDEYGDPVDVDQVVATNVPADIQEISQRVGEAGSGTLVTVRTWRGFVPHGTRIQDGMRIQDESSGEWFQVEHVTRVKSPVGPRDIKLELSTME